MEKGGFSANIITRLKRDNYVALDSIERICYALDCGVDDILEFIPDEKENGNNGWYKERTRAWNYHLKKIFADGEIDRLQL